MERFVIVMPVDTSAYLLPCDDGDTCKLETLQKLVGGPLKMWQIWALYDIAADFYADPENQAAFEAWQKQREKCKKTKRPCRRDSTGKAKG